MLLGTFHQIGAGYGGRLETLGIDVALIFVPAEPGNGENPPDWRIHLGEDGTGPKIGDGWDHVGERAGPYISLELDSPILPWPIRAWLFRSSAQEGEHHLVWNRPRPRDGGSE